MKIGDRIFVRGYIDEIRKDTVIVRNDGGYFGTIPSEVITGELPSAQPKKRTEERAETHACDLIDRQAAIDVADAVWSVTGDKNVAKVWDRIKELPSAQPETAKRIVGKSRDGMTLWYQCDMCNEPVDAQDNFCSGCGRRLVNE